MSSKLWLFISVLTCLNFAKGGVTYHKQPHSEPNLRIMNGDEAVPHSAPYMVGLLNTVTINSTTNGTSFCGGTLITPNYVLTAAHCFPNVTKLKIVLGAHKRRDVNETTRISMYAEKSALIPHPNYVPSDKHVPYDIGLIKLPSPVTYTAAVAPIALPAADDGAYDYVKGRIYGWGYTQVPPNSSLFYLATELREAELDIPTAAVCQAQSYVAGHELCVDVSQTIRLCSGDSGGPLVVAGQQVGVISGGKGKFCDDGSTYSIITNVKKFLDWIRANSDWTGQ